MPCLRTALLFLLCVLPLHAAASTQPAKGQFSAEKSCDLYQSLRKRSNPEGLRSKPGEQFSVLEFKSDRAGDPGWLRVRGERSAQPRWIEASCGQWLDAPKDSAARPSSKTTAHTPEAGGHCQRAGQHESFLLAISWQAGFCAHSREGRNKPECRALAQGQLRGSGLTLHGLWPQRAACGSNYGHCAASELQLNPKTQAMLREIMPSARFGDGLPRHQWQKHGSCQTLWDDDSYFQVAAAALQAFKQSPPARYIEENSGGHLRKSEFFQRIDAYFGNKQARNNFLLICNGPWLQEIRVQLPDTLRPQGSLKDMLQGHFNAVPLNAGNSCRSERILVETGGN